MMFTCRVCGKKDKTVQLLVGGIVGYAHEKCVKNLDRHIDIFLEFVVTTDNGVFYLAEELIKAHNRVHSSCQKVSE